MNRFFVLAAVGYVLVSAAVVVGLLTARNNVLTSDTAAADADWEKWRSDATKHDGKQYPVQRRVPKSDEPPLVVILRDHFAAATAGLLLPLTALYVFAAWVTHGLLRHQPPGASPRLPKTTGR